MTTSVSSAAPRLVRLAARATVCASMLVPSLSSAAQNVLPAADGSRGGLVTTAGCLANEADFIRANGMRPIAPGVDLRQHVVIIDGEGKAFSVNGTRERDLLTRVGSRVEVSGTLEGWTSDVSLERLPEDVPLGGAHEPSDAAIARIEGPVLTPPALRRINVRSFKAVDGDCAAIIRSLNQTATTAPDTDPPAVPRIAATAPVVERVRVQGCVLRDPSGSERLVLSQAVMRLPDVGAMSAVPGSRPSGSGSGTTPAPRVAGTTGATQAFYLIGQDTLTMALLGSRAEIVGTLGPAADVGSARPTGHPSAPARALAVETVRSIGGACAP